MIRAFELQLDPGELTPDRLRALRTGAFRRLDRYGTLALAAARRFRTELSRPLSPESALLTVSSFGPLTTSFGVLAELLTYPEEELSAGGFAHSVYNAASAVAALELGLHGPVLALGGFEQPEPAALELSRCWLACGWVPAVVLMILEEASPVTELAAQWYPERFPEPVVERLRVVLLRAGEEGE